MQQPASASPPVLLSPTLKSNGKRPSDGTKATPERLNRPRYHTTTAGDDQHQESDAHPSTSDVPSFVFPSIASTSCSESDRSSSRTSVGSRGGGSFGSASPVKSAAADENMGDASSSSTTGKPTPTSIKEDDADDMVDVLSDDEQGISPDVEQREPFYLPTFHHYPALAAAGGGGAGAGAAAAHPPAEGHQHHHHHQHRQHHHSAPPASTFPASASGCRRAAAAHEEDLLPCEVPECYYFIPSSDYQQHMLLHHPTILRRHREIEREDALSHHRLQMERQPKPTHATGGGTLIPCDQFGCGRLIQSDAYLTHQKSHEQEHHQQLPLQTSAPAATSSTPAETSPTSRSMAASPDDPSSLSLPDRHSWDTRYHRTPPTPYRGSDPNHVDDIIPSLTTIYEKRKDLEVYLCNPIQFFYRSKGDGGFGCGYKNIQTLCSGLLQFDLYCEVLFDGALIRHREEEERRTERFESRNGDLPLVVSPISPDGTTSAGGCKGQSSSSGPSSSSSSSSSCPPMPTISQLQSYIDRAHSRGFDVVGAAQVGQLRNSKTWIGAVEAHALFCSYGIRSELVDFKSSHVGLMEYVWNYFRERGVLVGADKNQQPHQRDKASTFDTHSQHYSPRTDDAAATDETRPNGQSASACASTASAHASGRSSHAFGLAPSSMMPAHGATSANFCPPLYFQHQGHSRTIIGIVRTPKTNRFRLLVLDPDATGGGPKLSAGLKQVHPSAALKTLYRTEDALRAKEYQMVMIASYGLMTRSEQEKSKRPFSTVISALEGPTLNGPDQPRGNDPRVDDIKQQSTPKAITSHERGSGSGGQRGDDGGRHHRPATRVGQQKEDGGASSSSSSSKRWTMSRQEVGESASARKAREVHERDLEEEGQGDGGVIDEAGSKAITDQQKATGKQQRPAPNGSSGTGDAGDAKAGRGGSPSLHLKASSSSSSLRPSSSSMRAQISLRRNIPVIPPSRLLPQALVQSRALTTPYPTAIACADDAAYPSLRTSGAKLPLSTAAAHMPRAASCSRLPESSRLMRRFPENRTEQTQQLRTQQTQPSQKQHPQQTTNDDTSTDMK